MPALSGSRHRAGIGWYAASNKGPGAAHLHPPELMGAGSVPGDHPGDHLHRRHGTIVDLPGILSVRLGTAENYISPYNKHVKREP